MAFVTDTFTGADGTDLTAHTGEVGATWTKVSGVTGVFKIIGNTAKGDSGGTSQYYASGTPSSAEYDVEADIHMISGVDYPGVGGRINGSTDDGYYVTYNDVTNNGWILFKIVAGTPTLLGTYGDILSAGNNRHIKLQIRDAAKKVFIDGVERISSSDNTITAAGNAGIRTRNSDWGFGSTGKTLDNFTATDVIVNVSVDLIGVAADPQIGVGTVEIGSVVVEPPAVGPGGGTGRPARTGMRLRPTEDKFVYLKGVAASPRVGQVMLLHEMQRAYEAYSAPIRRAEARKPAEMPPGMRRLFKPVEKPIPPAVFVYQVGLPKLKSAVGTGTVKAHYEEIDEEVITMIDLL